jgi:hypothetical protein
MKRLIALATGLLVISGTAFAFHCPADMKKIDAALAAKPALTEAQLKEVTTLRKQGEDDHKAGKHQQSVDNLAKAMNILKIDGNQK